MELTLKLLAAAILLFIGVHSAVDYSRFEASARHGDGVVKKVNSHSHATGRRGGKVYTYQPVIEFVPAGQSNPLTAATVTEISEEPTIGETVKIAYDPERPESTLRLDHGFPIPDGVAGLAGFALMGRVVADSINRFRKRKPG